MVSGVRGQRACLHNGETLPFPTFSPTRSLVQALRKRLKVAWKPKLTPPTYLWLVGNGRMVVIVVIIVPHSSIPYEPKVSLGIRLDPPGGRRPLEAQDLKNPGARPSELLALAKADVAWVLALSLVSFIILPYGGSEFGVRTGGVRKALHHVGTLPCSTWSGSYMFGVPVPCRLRSSCVLLCWIAPKARLHHRVSEMERPLKRPIF